MSLFKLFNENCKFENNISAEEINLLKALMKNKSIIIQKADKGHTVVITDTEKYIENIKRAISDLNEFVQLDIYLNYIINFEKKFKQLFRALLDNERVSKDEYDKICSGPGILKSTNRLLITFLNFHQFYLLYIPMDII